MSASTVSMKWVLWLTFKHNLHFCNNILRSRVCTEELGQNIIIIIIIIIILTNVIPLCCYSKKIKPISVQTQVHSIYYNK
jgi:hypothetical protein